MTEWLKSLLPSRKLRVLFLAQYAPYLPDFEPWKNAGDGGYPAYHANVCRTLSDLGCEVFPSACLSTLFTANGNIDYVYSLYNRMPIRNSEIFVASLCEYLRIPYLGASPAVRAVAEDKFLFKHLASSLGIPTPSGILYRCDTSPTQPPPFPPPYFVKDRTGAGSEGISSANIARKWKEAEEKIFSLHNNGKDALLETLISGIDITVPVVGGSPFHVFSPIHSNSDAPENILTHDLKLDDHLGYAAAVVCPETESQIMTHAKILWNILGPIDYFRMDYRYNDANGKLFLLEINICCHLEKESAIAIAASMEGIEYPELMSHILAFSLERQARDRDHLKWVL